MTDEETPASRKHVIYCRGCRQTWTEDADEEDAGCACTCSDPVAPHYEDWVTDLIAFLNARLDEDEAAVKAAASAAGPRWHQSDAVTAIGATTIIFYGQDDDIEIADTLRRDDEEIAPFIARYDPARALREVEADRELLGRYEMARKALPGRYKDGFVGALEQVIEIRAQRFSDHPDYDQEWGSLTLTLDRGLGRTPFPLGCPAFDPA